jgi:hypothetical protein
VTKDDSIARVEVTQQGRRVRLSRSVEKSFDCVFERPVPR